MCVSSRNIAGSDVGRLKSSAAGDSGKLAVVRHVVLQNHAIQRLVNQNGKLEFNKFTALAVIEVASRRA